MGKEETEKNRASFERNDGSYIKANREYLGLTSGQLIEGLCAKSMISHIESGNRGAGWLLQESLLQRGRVADEAYENYLDNEDYAEWRMQGEILDYLDMCDRNQMEAALERYADRYGLEKVLFVGLDFRQNAYDMEENAKESVTTRLRRQFYLGMLGMCRKLAGGRSEERMGIFRAALRQSMPEIDCELLQDRILSAREINLILEYAGCFPLAGAQRQYMAVKGYLENTPMEDDVKVLNYPKVLLLLCQTLQKKERKEAGEYAEIIQLCDLGIGLLRKVKRKYYLLELLEAKKIAIKQLEELNAKNMGGKEAFQGLLAENEKWIEIFSDLCGRFGVEQGQLSDAYLYYGQERRNAGDIIRTRRKMLKMTQKELCERVGCNLDTLRDLEKKRHGTSSFYLQEMCAVLGLPPLRSRTELVTANPKARELEKEIRYAANDGRFQKNLEQLEELKGMIDMTNRMNRQWVLRTEGMARHELGLMDDTEYEEMVKQALECTLPMSILEYPDEKECYLTNSEMECIYHYSLLVCRKNAKEAYERMKVVFRQEEELEAEGIQKRHIRTYELYMGYKAVLLCEIGEYEAAKQYAKKVIRLCLRTGRINILDGALYIWMRSNVKIQKKEAEPQKASYDWRKDLECCLALSRFCQNRTGEQFYDEVLAVNKIRVALEAKD